MFLTSDIISETPAIGTIRLAVPKEQALRTTQALFLEGRQINALYICTHDELVTANERKLAWLSQADNLISTLFSGNVAIDFFDEVTINVVKDSAPIESQSELFHNEMNQRLERLREVRHAIEELPDETPTSRRPAAPSPKPVEVEISEVAAVPSPTEQAGLSSAAEIGSALISQPVVLQVARSGRSDVVSVAPDTRCKIMLILCSRNGTARQALCRFGNQMNLSFEIVDYNPEQPHRIVDDIYRHRDAKFAVVYWGEPSGREMPGQAHPERYVGFSLGFVLGRLGRGRVFILGSSTTLPLPGCNRILVAQLDSTGGWQIQLARRMKSAGVNIDLNKLT